MKMETLEKKIAKQSEKVAALKIKYDDASKKYTDASKELNNLVKLKEQELAKERYSSLEKVCKEKNVDIKRVADALASGKLDVLLNTMEKMDRQEENGVEEMRA